MAWYERHAGPFPVPQGLIAILAKISGCVKTTHQCVQDFLVFLESEHFIYNLIYGT